MYDIGMQKLLESMEPEERLEVALKLLRERDGTGCVYFIVAPELNRVKIGYAHKPYKRLQDLQVASPCKLVLYKYVRQSSMSTEKALHTLYEHLRGVGEWFDFNEELKLLVEKVDIS